MVKVTNLVCKCTDRVNFIFLKDALLKEAIRKRRHFFVEKIIMIAAIRWVFKYQFKTKAKETF